MKENLIILPNQFIHYYKNSFFDKSFIFHYYYFFNEQ